QPAGGHSGAMGIKDNGAVVGWSFDRVTGDEHGFMYSGGTTTDLFPAGIFEATAINNSGQLTGSNSVAIRYNGSGSVLTLGTLGAAPSKGWGINSAGDIVGTSRTGAKDPNFNYIEHPFLYTGGLM